MRYQGLIDMEELTELRLIKSIYDGAVRAAHAELSSEPFELLVARLYEDSQTLKAILDIANPPMNPEPANRTEALDALTAESQKMGLYDIDITVCNGKYRIVANSDMSGFRALRYGEEWRDLTGDKLVLALVYEVLGLRERVDELRDSR